MDTNFAAITIFTLLFAVTTARISFDPTPTNLHVAHTDFHRQPKCVVQDSDLQFVHSLTRKPGSDETLKSDKDRGVKIDLTPRSDLARFHAINRYFSENEPRVPIRSVHTRPNLYFQSSFVKPESKVTHGNDATTTGKNKSTRSQFHDRHSQVFEAQF
ncbi:hypothetical protein E3N88_08280 [Mikania micrantha]|uniref:Uncharacterized protein n=1 Tax=Mikania micrantha TaxID=192012 RepID=A0A5N6PIV9_9ASTR|nr:hypothetical protein E3N88_08280 [Mikania micrantha]